MFILKEFKIGYTGLTAMAYGNGKIKSLCFCHTKLRILLALEQ